MSQIFEPMNFTPHPVEGRPQNSLLIPLSQRNSSVNPDRDIQLPEGVNRLMLEWQGLTELVIRLRREAGATSDVIKFLASGESWITTIPLRSEGHLWFALRTAPSEAELKHNLAVTIIPGPPVGAAGGGGSLRSILGAARRLVAGWAK